MDIEQVNVLDLIPQRPPMVMIDRLVFCQGTVARSALFIKEDNVFVRDGFLTESGMIEAMAQTAAARTGWLISLKKEKVEDGNAAPVGVIGSIKDFRLSFRPSAEGMMETTIELMHEFMNASVVRGSIKVNGTEACSAEMKIFLTDDNPL